MSIGNVESRRARPIGASLANSYRLAANMRESQAKRMPGVDRESMASRARDKSIGVG